MGIEPTSRRLYLRPNDFEDRGGHQPSKHFRGLFLLGFVRFPFSSFHPCTTVMLFEVVVQPPAQPKKAPWDATRGREIHLNPYPGGESP